MAWWTDILGLKKYFEAPQTNCNGTSVLAVLARAIRKAFYDNFVGTIHVILLVATYTYLALSIAAFFLQEELPRQIGYIVDAFSEPYLGVLGIYVVVNEIRRRRGKVAHHHFANIFAGAWAAFLVISTLTVILGNSYYFNDIYRTVVTNSLAALIIRLGSILSKIPP